MAEFNKIFTKSPITIDYINMSILCFIDGLIVSSDKYALATDKLDIYKQSLDSVNLFYNYNKSIVYEYNLVLTNSGVVVSGMDLNGNDLSTANITSNRVMVFVNGRLLGKDEYLVNSATNEITLLYTIPQNIFQKVIVYVSKAGETIQTGTDITYKKFVLTDNINLARNNPDNPSYDPSVFYIYINNTSDPTVYSINNYIPFQYSINSSIIFVNGKKLDNIFIDASGQGFKINKEDLKAYTTVQERTWNPVTQQYDIHNVTYTGEGYSDIIEFYDLGNSTESVNFYNTLGFTTFNYKDSNQKRIPLLYNCVVTFNDIVKYTVDNINTGFFIKENIGNGVAIIVDNEFETTKVRCYIEPLSIFLKSSYATNEYYLEAPDVKSITEYLADYDNQHKLLPSILEVFQQTLLKEVYDSINRIRDIRSIDRVDSYHINKLIEFLGMDIDIKTLPLKRRHELLEELNNWYRIVGTKDSLNIFNILQDDVKLVQIDQLFTPSFNMIDPDAPQYYYYTYTVTNGGTGYHRYDRLEFLYDVYGDQSLYETYYFTVMDVEPETGTILRVEPETYEGTINFPGVVWSTSNNLRNQDLNLSTTITTTSSSTLYDYDYGTTPLSQTGAFHVGQELCTDDNAYKFRVTSVDSNGVITSWTKLIGPDNGTDPISVPSGGFPLVITAQSYDLNLIISNTLSGSTQVFNDTTPGNNVKQRSLSRGVYNYYLYGGGGSGSAGDSGHGRAGDVPTENGYKGYYTSGTFTLNNTATLNYWVGGGGIGGMASLYKWWKPSRVASAGGPGYQSGAQGGEDWFRYYTRISGHWCYGSHDGVYIVAGGGGGSSRIYINGIIDKVAAGGQGGGYVNSTSWRNSNGVFYNINTVGGVGGNNGGKTGTGVSGGLSAYNRGGNNTWGANGANGSVRLTKNLYTFTTSISGYNSGILVGDTFKTANGEYTVVVTSTSGGVITGTVTSTIPAFNDGSLPISETYPLYLVTTGNAKLNVISTFNNKSVSYNYGNLNGLTQYLYEGAVVTGTISSSGYTTHPNNATTTLNVVGTITGFDRSTGTITGISWSPLGINNSTNENEVIVRNFNNTLVNLSITTGTGQVDIMVTSQQQNATYALQEYVDFRTKEELGAIPHIEYVGDNILDYGYIMSAVQQTLDYGSIENNADNHLDYGYITDRVKGQYVKWYEWDRDPNWYPTNHVDVYIKIEATDDAENIKNRFITQFYSLASTVLYIHRLIMCYYFGNSTINLPSGITSLDKTPTFLGIQTTSMVSTETITFTSDPNRQHNTDNLSCVQGTIKAIKNNDGLIEYVHIV